MAPCQQVKNQKITDQNSRSRCKKLKEIVDDLTKAQHFLGVPSEAEPTKLEIRMSKSQQIANSEHEEIEGVEVAVGGQEDLIF